MPKNGEMIRIVLVDDHAVLRSGMRYILDVVEAVEVVGEASNGLEAIELCETLEPDIVLMDLMMPEMDGIEATRAITAAHPQTRVIVLTSFEDGDNVNAALDAGAISFLTKNISASDLTAAIQKAYANESTMSPEAVQSLIAAKKAPKVPGSNLSEREKEVLAQLAQGLTNTEIAEVLFISRATVKRHVSNILTKLDVKTRTEAVALALKYKIVR